MANRATTEDKELLNTFEPFETAPGDFDHHAHIRMAYQQPNT